MVTVLTPGPGRKPAFDREQAIQAALSEGVGSFSIRGVADRLGIKPPALYRMFSSRDELQAAAMEKLATDIEAPTMVASWQEALRLVASRSWELFCRHPEAPTVIMTKPDAMTGAVPRFEELVHRLVELNIPGGLPTASFAVDFIGDTTVCTFLQMQYLTTTDETGETPLDRYTKSTEESEDVFGVKNMPDTGFLDAKVEFIITSIEHGIGPHGTPTTNRCPDATRKAEEHPATRGCLGR